MKKNFDYENLKSIKFPKNYENRDTFNKTNESVNSQALKEKLSILENKIKFSNPNKNLQQFNLNLENNHNTISNFDITKENKYERFNEKQGINNSIKLMDIKLNHQILQNKIENMRKTLIKKTNDSNYYTISTSNYLDFNPLNSMNNFQSYSNTPKNYNNRIDFDHKIISKDKENNINFINLNKEEEEFSNRNNYQTSKDFYNTRNQFKTIDYQSSERFKNTNFSKKIGLDRLPKETDEQLLRKTIGNGDYERNSIFPKFKINNNEMRLDYTKKDLADLEGKIQITKKKLNDFIHRAETLIIDKRINKNIIDRDISNDIHKQYAKYKTIDSKSLREDKKLLDDNEYLNNIDDSNRVNKKKRNFKNSNDYRSEHNREKRSFNNDKIKNLYPYEQNSSR